ncbi:MAG: outer membrane lipoprotein LolB [Alteromonadaceae bacterium]|jgi:outer membrane lipoprotein LolB
MKKPLLALKRLQKPLQLCLVVLLSLLLTACQSPRHAMNQVPDNQSRASRQDALQQLQHWQVKGKFLFKGPQKKQSVSLNWTQDLKRSDIRLTTFMGISVLKMVSDQHSATLKTDDQTVTSNDPQKLLNDNTGIALPVNSLADWMKGALPVEQGLNALGQKNGQVVMWDEFNRIKQIRLVDKHFIPWQIDYLGYSAVESHQLPQKIRLTGNDIKITITINDWELSSD